MGTEAIRTAMSDAQVTWSDIDLLIDCSTSRHRPIPCNAAHFLNAAGKDARGIPGFDIQSTCLSFIVGLHTANALMAGGAYRRVILVASESPLTAVNWQQPESAGLMGDGAAAVVLCYSPTNRPMVMRHETYAENLDLCQVNGGAHHLPAWNYTPERSHEFRFDMNGPALFRTAAVRLPKMAHAALDAWKNDCSNHGIQCENSSSSDLTVVPHQASPKALEIIQELMPQVPSERFLIRVRETGNLVAASVPFLLDQSYRDGTIQSNSPVMLLGTSAGYSQAALIFTPFVKLASDQNGE